ncbi:hypothetical protein ACLOJK_022368 [Asimina triloba]
MVRGDQLAIYPANRRQVGHLPCQPSSMEARRPCVCRGTIAHFACIALACMHRCLHACRSPACPPAATWIIARWPTYRPPLTRRLPTHLPLSTSPAAATSPAAIAAHPRHRRITVVALP